MLDAKKASEDFNKPIEELLKSPIHKDVNLSFLKNKLWTIFLIIDEIWHKYWLSKEYHTMCNL